MTAFLLFLLVLLVLVNGFFVAAEFALVRSRRSQLEKLAEEGSRGATQAVRAVDRIDEYLSAAQVGITMTSIGLGFLGEPALAQLLEPVFGGVVSHGVAVAISVAIAYALVTAAHVIVGEQAPKMMAISRSESVLRWTAVPFEWFRVVFRPVIWALNSASNFVVTRILRIEIEGDLEEMSSEELKQLVLRGRQLIERGGGGKLDEGEVEMLHGVFHLHEQEARQVMTPIPAVVTVNADETVQVGLERCVDSGHTRLLVIEDDNPDRVKGIVHANGLARALIREGPEAPLQPLVRQAPVVPETKPLDDLLRDMRLQRTSLAVIADEYGRTAGIVTIEDIIEEIVGEIVDETDPVLSPVRRLVNGDWFVRGHVSLDDLADEAGVRLQNEPDTPYTSVGGFVFDELGRLPKRGDEITKDGYSIRVESVRENRVEAVRIRESVPPREPEPEGSPTG